MDKLEDYSVVGPYQINEIAEVVKQTLAGNKLQITGIENNKRLNLPKIRRNNVVEIVPICAGCLGYCSYCIVKRARGSLFSYNERAIIKQIESAVKDNVKEIWLTAQDTGCYGKDIKSNLPKLLKKILGIKGDFKIRLGMCNPNFALEYLKDLIKIFKHEKMFKFLHIPVQSGNDDILKKMNRKYKAKDFVKIVQTFRKNISKITIATDIICGFPGETEKQFNDSIELIKKVRPDVLNISRFWARPETIAEKMPNQLRGEETKNRSRKMNKVFDSIALEQNKKWLGWKGRVIIDEIGKDNSFVGRNYCYKPVILKGKYKLGQKVKVEVKDVTRYDLRA